MSRVQRNCVAAERRTIWRSQADRSSYLFFPKSAVKLRSVQGSLMLPKTNLLLQFGLPMPTINGESLVYDMELQ